MKEHIGWITHKDVKNHLVNYQMVWPGGYWPKTIAHGEQFDRRWLISLPEKIRLIGIWTFLGHDAGDRAESDINISSEFGIPLVRRSDHRHFVDYDADIYYPLEHLRLREQILRVNLHSHPTSQDAVRYHVVIDVIGRYGWARW